MAARFLFDFDQIEEWAPRVDAVLLPLLPADIESELQAAVPEYVEDARDLIIARGGRETVGNAVLAWLASGDVAGYHGTRVAAADEASINQLGLLPLVAVDRKARLVRALSSHPGWALASTRLDEAIDLYGSGAALGKREGQAHLTISRKALIEGFNHYLQCGSEIDGHIASELFGEEGRELLRKEGRAVVFRFRVPGDLAVQLCHPYVSPAELMARGDMPNLAGEIISAWAYRKAYPALGGTRMMVDCGLVFDEVVPPHWIVGSEVIDDAVLED